MIYLLSLNLKAAQCGVVGFHRDLILLTLFLNPFYFNSTIWSSWVFLFTFVIVHFFIS